MSDISFKDYFNNNTKNKFSYTRNDNLSIKWVTENNTPFKHELVETYDYNNEKYIIFKLSLKTPDNDDIERFVECKLNENNVLTNTKITKNKSEVHKNLEKVNLNEHVTIKNVNYTRLSKHNLTDNNENFYSCTLKL